MLKDAAPAELPEAVTRILNGELYVQPALGAMLPASGVTPPTDADPIDALSERERGVLDLLVLGHTNVEIASLIFLSPRTIETHRANIQRSSE
jgi:two-component system response regulator NreC